MYSSSTSRSSEEAANSDSKLAVAHFLSSMANGEHANTNNQFPLFDGYTSGIPTRTTPTLTPTTLKNIEEFIELQSVPPEPIKHQHQAGFVPPFVPIPAYSDTINSDEDSDMSEMQGESAVSSSSEMNYQQQDFNIASGSSMSMQTQTRTGKSGNRSGGRKPNNSIKCTPEEAERRQLRRERNKMAAARCRKRRVDHTNTLVQETENLEDKRQNLQSEIQMLECQKEELRFILEAHKATCQYSGRLDNYHTGIKSEDIQNVHSSIVTHSRPNSLPIATAGIPSLTSTSTITSLERRLHSSNAGISISTPSSGIFNFDSYVEGGTGLTPVTSSGLTPVIPSCSTQQRNSSSDLSSPDTVNPPKLVSL